MTTAAINNPALNLRQLTADISRSVENLRLKEQGLYDRGLTTQKGAETQQNGAVLSGYAVTYLTPQAAYTVQSFISENKEVNEQRRSNVFRDGEQTAAETEKTLPAEDGHFFAEELAAFLSPENDYADAARAYAPAENPTAAAEMSDRNLYSSGFGYAAAVYDYVFNINNQPRVLIDYMHEYNRSFDFRI